jgi:hypothetical protein
MAARTPYADTSVPVERSKSTIRDLLRNAGALGVQFEEEWGDAPLCRVRFAWPTEAGRVLVRLEVAPLPPGHERNVGKVDAAQRERQAWRGLAWYLEGNLKAAAFGLVRFEDIFLSFIESTDGRTIGEALIPQIVAGRLALPAADGGK